MIKKLSIVLRIIQKKRRVILLKVFLLKLLKKMNDLFLDRLPKNVVNIKYNCPQCGEENKKKVDNLIDFFT